MTERNPGEVTKEVESFLNNLNKQADAARELLVNMINIADSFGQFPTLFFTEDPHKLRSRKAVFREQKALFLGFSYREQGGKRVVILGEDGKVSSTKFGNVYRVQPAEHSRHKTSIKLGRIQYSPAGEELTGIDFLHWFPTASNMLLDLINK